MESPSVIVILLMVGLWAVYLAPHAMRSRLNARDTRVDDRYSKDLRILAVVDPHEAVEPHSHDRLKSVATPPHGIHMKAALHLEGAGMVTDRSPDPAREAMLARRGAAARRRALLTATLLALTIMCAVLANVTTMPWGVILLPASLFVTVLVLGRRAVITQQRVDREWAQRQRGRSERPRSRNTTAHRDAMTPTEARIAAQRVRATQRGEDVATSALSRAEIQYVASTHRTGSAVSADVSATSARSPVAAPRSSSRQARDAASSGNKETATPTSDARAQSPQRSDASGRQQAPQRPTEHDAPAQEPATAAPWQAVPVPPPVYTLKAAAPSWEPPGITQELQQLTAARLAAIAADSTSRPTDPSDGGVAASEFDPEHERPDSLGLDLNSILARRRAV
ncbi:hypothetical protein [Jonesia quinghaiensis]|uniref:hypothetical protein n=1 Tax=Jonesia quinghaiensis TaxID=262806 RepID=UPI0012F91B37|nr:hypothetical protein [Jonesia quinghaiensis]